MEKLLCTIPEAVNIASVSRSVIYQLLSDGSIQAVKTGRSTRIVVASLSAWVATLPVATFKQSTAVRKEVR